MLESNPARNSQLELIETMSRGVGLVAGALIVFDRFLMP
jgi:hypothetical protein